MKTRLEPLGLSGHGFVGRDGAEEEADLTERAGLLQKLGHCFCGFGGRGLLAARLVDCLGQRGHELHQPRLRQRIGQLARPVRLIERIEFGAFGIAFGLPLRRGHGRDRPSSTR